MSFTKSLPLYIQDAFAANNANASDFIAFFYSDMLPDGKYADVYIAFDKENLFILSGMSNVKKAKGSIKIKAFYEQASFKVIPLKSIMSAVVERYLSTAKLLITGVDDQTSEIAFFSLGIANEASKFIRNLTAFKENKPYNEQEDDDPFCAKCGMRYPDSSHKVCPKCMNKKAISLRLLSFFKLYYKQLIGYFSMLILSTAFAVAAPYIGTKILYDNVLTEGGSLYGEVLLIVLLILGVRIIGLFFEMAQGYISASIIPKVIYDIEVRVMSAMQRLSIGFYTGKQTGNLMTRIQSDTNSVYWFFIDGVPNIIINVFIIIGITVVMFLMNPLLASITVGVLSFLLLSYIFLQSVFKTAYRSRFIHQSNMTSHISDTMAGQRVIKAFGKENQEAERFLKLSKKFSNAEKKVADMQGAIFPFFNMLANFIYLIVLAVGSIIIVTSKGQDLSLGQLMVFASYINMLYAPINFFSYAIDWWSHCMDSSQRIFEVMDAVSDVPQASYPVSIKEMKGDIDCKEVLFEYDPGRPVIKDLNLSVKSGQMLGIVGKTGAGKSTLVNLMARLYDVTEGSITIDGVNVKDISIEDMRKNIGIVSQEIYLFIGTVADNIRYARPDASYDEVIAAAKAASAHDFIMRLPDGYQTRIGAGGQDLSGGEKQRISIARTLIQNPNILILDEATAAMDTQTERNIQESLNVLKKNRTTIAIAHRLSTLRDADILAVIDNGTMTEYGTHNELIHKKGTYYTLYQLQFEAVKHISFAETEGIQ
ncbi:MAG: ABC transporter ATP-binding protein [Clostridiales bacterium]|nr:MAG: ABC transporter ATP-binding protein [Clostridiales bacterium]